MSDLPKISLLKRDNGFWYVLYEDSGRVRWKSTHTRSREGALKAVMRLKEFLRPKPETAPLLSNFSKDLLEYTGSTFAAKTTIMYEAVLKRLQKVAGDLLLSELTSKHLDLYSAERLKTIKPVSVNIEIRTLRAALSVAVRWQLLERNPFRESPLLRVPEQTPAYFSRDDFKKLVFIIKELWLKEVVIFAVLTGMRRGEIVNLNWDNVDLARKLIFVQSTSTFRTKQGKRRTIPMSDVVFHLLNSKFRKCGSGYVFTLNGHKIKDDWITQKLKYYVYAAHLEDDRLHFHSLRHTFATWLVQDGASLYEVQRLLGHSNMTMTQVYSHLQPEQLHKTVNRIQLSLN